MPKPGRQTLYQLPTGCLLFKGMPEQRLEHSQEAMQAATEQSGLALNLAPVRFQITTFEFRMDWSGVGKWARHGHFLVNGKTNTITRQISREKW